MSPTNSLSSILDSILSSSSTCSLVNPSASGKSSPRYRYKPKPCNAIALAKHISKKATIHLIGIDLLLEQDKHHFFSKIPGFNQGFYKEKWNKTNFNYEKRLDMMCKNFELLKNKGYNFKNYSINSKLTELFGYEELKKINPAIVYASVSAYGPDGPNSKLAGNDAIGQALSGIPEAFSMPGQPMRTGVVSVADESCAMLTFGGVLAAVIHAKSTGIGQKVETSLVGSAFRLMGWTMTTTMWKNAPPITGARINGTPERPGIAACFNDCYGKPLAIQLCLPAHSQTGR